MGSSGESEEEKRQEHVLFWLPEPSPTSKARVASPGLDTKTAPVPENTRHSRKVPHCLVRKREARSWLPLRFLPRDVWLPVLSSSGGGWGADSGVESPGGPRAQGRPPPSLLGGAGLVRRWSVAGSALFSSLTLEWSLHLHSLCDCQALSLVLPFDEALLQDAVFLKPYSVEYGIVLAYWFMQDAKGPPCTSR